MRYETITTARKPAIRGSTCCAPIPACGAACSCAADCPAPLSVVPAALSCAICAIIGCGERAPAASAPLLGADGSAFAVIEGGRRNERSSTAESCPPALGTHEATMEHETHCVPMHTGSRSFFSAKRPVVP